MITVAQQAVLADIFTNTENLGKITVSLDKEWRRVLIVYDKLDSQWYEELLAAEGQP
jgi:hypothetical protein